MPRPKQRNECRTLIAAEVPREQLQADEWFKALQPDHCMFCQSTEWAPGWSPMTFIRCSGCSVKAFHVGCLQKSGLAVTQDVIEDDADVFCSQDCEKISQSWNDKLGKKLKVKGEASEYSLEVIKYNPKDKGTVQAVDHAIRIFRSCFSKLVMDNGKDLIEMVCRSYESPPASSAAGDDSSSKARETSSSDGDNSTSDSEDEPDIFSFGQFRLLSLRKGPAFVSVATLRVFGSHFAEMPFIATREGYRREGNCRRMVKAVDDLLHSMGVRYLVLPSILSVLSMWTNKFRFSELSPEEYKALLDCEIVQMEAETTKLVKRRVGLPMPVSSAKKTTSSLGASTAAATRPQRSSSITQKSNATSNGRTASKITRGRKPIRGAGKKAGSINSGSDSDSSSSSEDESGSEYSGTSSESSESADSGLEPEGKVPDSQQDSDEVTSPMSRKTGTKKGRGPATGKPRAPLSVPRKIWPFPSPDATMASALASIQANAGQPAPASESAAAGSVSDAPQATGSDKPAVAAAKTGAVPQLGKPPVASRKRPAGAGDAGRNSKQPRVVGTQQGKPGSSRPVRSARSQQLAKQVKVAAAARRAAAQDAMLAVTLAESVAHALMGRDALQAQLAAMRTYIAHLEGMLLKQGNPIEQFVIHRPPSLPPLASLLQLPAPLLNNTGDQTTSEQACQRYNKECDPLVLATSQQTVADVSRTQHAKPQRGVFPHHNPKLYPAQYLHDFNSAERAVAMYATAVLQAGIQVPRTPDITANPIRTQADATRETARTADFATQTTEAMDIDDCEEAPAEHVNVSADNVCTGETALVLQRPSDSDATAIDVHSTNQLNGGFASNNTYSSCSDHLLDMDLPPSEQVHSAVPASNSIKVAKASLLFPADSDAPSGTFAMCRSTDGQYLPGHAGLSGQGSCIPAATGYGSPVTMVGKGKTVNATDAATPRLDDVVSIGEDLLSGWKHTAVVVQTVEVIPKATSVVTATSAVPQGCTAATLPAVQAPHSDRNEHCATEQGGAAQLSECLDMNPEPLCEGASPRASLPPLPPTPTVPAAVTIGRIEEAPQTSPDFASPLTMRSFHSHCLDKLVPQVIHSWLESPSPSMGAITKTHCDVNQSPQPLQPTDSIARPRSKGRQRSSLVTAVFGVSLDSGSGGSSSSIDDHGDADVSPADNARDSGAAQEVSKVLHVAASQSQQDLHDNTASCEEEKALQIASKFCSWNQFL